MTTASPLLGTPTAMTMTLASLASDTNLVAGRESTAVDNSSVDGIDALVGGKVTLGTGPTASRQIEIWLYGSYDGTSFGGGASGSDANLTPQGSSKYSFRLLTILPTAATTNQTYTWGPFSVAQAFGGVMPYKWGVYIVHNTGVALNATAGNHEVKYTSVKYESA